MKRWGVWGVWGVRIGVPGLMALGGLALLIWGDAAGKGSGTAILGSAALVVLVGAFLRLASADQRDRDAEEERRLYFDRHGRWPDDD